VDRIALKCSKCLAVFCHELMEINELRQINPSGGTYVHICTLCTYVQSVYICTHFVQSCIEGFVNRLNRMYFNRLADFISVFICWFISVSLQS